MSAIAAGIASGHYARKQLHGAAWFITWSHRRRFQLACRLAAEFHGRRLLDYGCGGGTFIADFRGGVTCLIDTQVARTTACTVTVA
jgi:2-polyprenyl-3-methyl-5-hydroxy-6-metoxy-1,4-benzoquinol methylase